MDVSVGQLRFDEIFVTSELMRRYFRFLGLFPYLTPCVDDRYEGHWARWQPLMVTQTLFLTVYAIYSTFVDMIAFLPNRMEKYVMGALVLELMIGVLINVSCLLANSSHWPAFFQRWSAIDRLLDIHVDHRLRRHSRLLVIGFTCYTSFLVSFTIPTAVLLLVLPDLMAIRPAYILGIFTYAFHWSICLLLPELFCLFLLLAICSRMRAIAQQLSTAFSRRSTMDMDVEEEVEKLRVAYQLLMDVMGHMRQVLGPVLVTTCILHGLPLPLFVYSFVKQGQNNVTIKLLEIVAFITSFLRVAVMCLMGQKVNNQSKSVTDVLQDAPSHSLSINTNEQVILFVNCVGVSSSKVSAWGFLDVDNGYLQSVVGVMIAYTVTIMQFEMNPCLRQHHHHHYQGNISAAAELSLNY